MVIRGNDTHEIINGASAIVYIFSFFILFYCFLFDFYSTYSFIFMFVMLSVVQCDTPTCWVQLACCTLRSARSGVSNKEKKNGVCMIYIVALSGVKMEKRLVY